MTNSRDQFQNHRMRFSNIIIRHLELSGTYSVPMDSDLSLVNDLGADSLDLVELCMAVEEEFGVEIEDREIESIETIGQVYDMLAAWQEGKQPISNVVSQDEKLMALRDMMFDLDFMRRFAQNMKLLNIG